jgi:dTDP-4-amino-4,6-dideoxygalactose transaminase
VTGAWLSVYPGLSPGVWLSRRVERPAFPLGRPRCRLFGRAREGLWQALRALGPQDGDEVLIPAYHHGSEVETVIRAGYACRFFGGHHGVEPDEDELDTLVSERTRALYVIHSLGFTRDPARWRRWCDVRGLRLVEDAAQAWLSGWDGTPAGAVADISIFCLYKTVPTPDGGALHTAPDITVPPPVRRPGGASRALIRLHRNHLVARVGSLGRLRPNARLGHRRDEEPEQEFRAHSVATRPARSSLFLTARIDGQEVASRRRRHYHFLRDRLSEHVPAPFRSLDPAASPLAFPIEAEDKRGLLDHLARHGIVDGKLWMVPHPSLPRSGFEQATRLRRHLVGLPLHQGLREEDLERVVGAARAWFAGGGR